MKKSTSRRKGRPAVPTTVIPVDDFPANADEIGGIPIPADRPPILPPGDENVTSASALTATEKDGASADNGSDANVQSRAEAVDVDDLNVMVVAVNVEADTEQAAPAIYKTVVRDEYFQSRVIQHMALQGEETEVALRRGELHYHDWKWLSEHPLTGEDEKERGKYWTHFVEEQLGVPVRTATLHRRVYEFYTHVQPVARPYLCRVGMTKLDLAITLKNAGVRNCAYNGIKDLTFSPDSITVTIESRNPEGVDEETVYDFADTNLTVRMLRERMPQAYRKSSEGKASSLDEKYKKLKQDFQKIRQERDVLQAQNTSLQQRAAQAELQQQRLLEEVKHLREQLNATLEDAPSAEV